MAKDVILLGEVAARGATMSNIRCGRCDRHGRLSVRRLRAEWEANASIRDVMHEQRLVPAPGRYAAIDPLRSLPGPGAVVRHTRPGLIGGSVL